MAPTRDYYADLELPPSADIPEIKKQFRRLALKYHPDRNPGREVEVNSQFQVIQSAHEVLSDPQKKARYDVTYNRSSRFPGASGVKGNPWQNVGQQFPTPPRRNTAARAATSGAQRWSSRFSNGVPPTSKQQTASDSEAKNAARAFENMRSRPAQQETRPPPPPPPPRTESARQRAQAAFRTRKAGFQPRSSVPGDEPPVSSRNYFSRSTVAEAPAPNPPPRKPRPTTMSDPLEQFRTQEGSADIRNRQSSPYAWLGSEKTDPFDGIPAGRGKFTVEPNRRDASSTAGQGLTEEQRHRSSSVPKFPLDRPEGACSRRFARPAKGFKPGATAGTANDSPSQARGDPSSCDAPVSADKTSNYADRPRSARRSGSAPSMYDIPDLEDTNPCPVSASNFTTISHAYDSVYGRNADSHSGLAPSGNQDSLPACTPFERQQRVLLDQLIRTREGGSQLKKEKLYPHAFPSHDKLKRRADMSLEYSFHLIVGDDILKQTHSVASENQSLKNSVDDISTRFVHDSASPWSFNAGNGTRGSLANNTSQPVSGRRTHRHSPHVNPDIRKADETDETRRQPKVEAAAAGFNANGWKFSPQNFAPQPVPGVSASPTRSNRANSKRVRVKPTTGTATFVDESSSNGEAYEWHGRNAPTTKNESADSPLAMDIDSLPSAPRISTPEPSSARNIPVEPSRPEWRPGNVDSVTSDSKPARPEKIPVEINVAGGSEDSDEFKASFAGLKDVPPLGMQKTGLGSLDDLKADLPFESKASEDVPISLPPKAHRLTFPAYPEAPRLPPTVAIEGMRPNAASWVKYLADFENYLRLWDKFNDQVVDHFATRKTRISGIRQSKGYAFLGTRGDGDIREYFSWVQQDNNVRQRWNAACEQHEMRLGEFMAFREKMK